MNMVWTKYSLFVDLDPWGRAVAKVPGRIPKAAKGPAA